jgi:hypothetical protein
LKPLSGNPPPQKKDKILQSQYFNFKKQITYLKIKQMAPFYSKLIQAKIKGTVLVGSALESQYFSR